MSDETDRPGGSRDIPGTLFAPTETLPTDTLELYEFGPFRLDPKERKLVRGTELVALTPKVFDTLHLLVRNSGHLLEKQELVRQLWPDSFVEEGNPNQVLVRGQRARALVTHGKTEEAVAEAERLLTLSPAVADWDMAVWIFILARRYDLARERAGDGRLGAELSLGTF